MRAIASILAAAALLASGCGGDDEDDPAAPAPPPSTTQAAPPPSTAPPETEPRREREEPASSRTPRSLAACIRALPGVADVLVKGRDNEDARFFADLVGGRVDVLGVTLEGQSAELSVFLFASEADARKAAPSAGGGGVEARTAGSAVVAGPPGAKADQVDDCLRVTGYG